MIDRRAHAAEKRRAFRLLHEAGCFVIPNPWDIGGVRFLQSLGFEALATTSSGHSWSQGCPDGALSLGSVLTHLLEIVEASASAQAARLLAEQGRFDGFANALPGQDLDAFFRDDSRRREGEPHADRPTQASAHDLGGVR